MAKASSRLENCLRQTAESLPFPNSSFDVIYPASVLEHTQDPEQVLREALRVLRPGGQLYMEFPNYLSYFEGHYMLIQPPILWKSLLPWWVKNVFGRDSAFAQTLQTKINPQWCRRQIRELGEVYKLDQISLGEKAFLSRLSKAFVFETRLCKATSAGF